MLTFADVTDSAERAIEALATYEILDVEQTFAVLFGEATVERAINLIAQNDCRRSDVMDYKTDRTASEQGSNLPCIASLRRCVI